MRFWPKRQIEEKAGTLAAPDPQLLELFGLTGLGPIAIGPAEALAVPAVNCAIRAISEAAATLDRSVLVRDGDGKETPDHQHPVAELLRGEVNDWTSAFEFIRDIVAMALTQDAGGIAWINRVDGRPHEIILYRSGLIQVATKDTGEPTFSLNGRALNGADVIHLRGPFNKCPLTMAATAIGVAHFLELHAGKLFKSGARPAGIIQIPRGVGEKQIRAMKEGWRNAHEGAENAGKTAILFDGAQFIAVTLNSTDAQFLENRKFQIEEIARAFRVPVGMLYQLDRVTWSNGEQQAKEFLSYTLEPWLQALEGTLTRALFTPEERKTHRIAIDRDDLTRASLTERATAISSLRATEVICANEGRDWLGLSPRDGGDEFENPNINPRAAGDDADA